MGGSLSLMALLSEIKVVNPILVPYFLKSYWLCYHVYKETTKIRNLKEFANCKFLYGENENNSTVLSPCGVRGIAEDGYTSAICLSMVNRLGVT